MNERRLHKHPDRQSAGQTDYINFDIDGFTVVCISNFTARPGRKMSAVVGWVNVKDWSILHLKALTVTFKLMK